MTTNINEDIESRLGKLSYYSGHHELKELKNKVDSKLKDLKEQSVYVMIVGDGKRGKSTLLNALIGQNLAEVNLLPKTWRIDTYTTADNEYAELVWEENGDLASLGQIHPSNLKHYTMPAESKYKEKTAFHITITELT